MSKSPIPKEHPKSKEVPTKKTDDSFGIPNYRGPIMLLFLCAVGIWIYILLNNPTTEVTDSLFERVHDTEKKMSEIGVTVRDNKEQLSQLVEDYYASEYKQAREIAERSGYPTYWKLVSVQGNVVRLSDYDRVEIEVNINIGSKTITRFR